jgi:hypothetical protein
MRSTASVVAASRLLGPLLQADKPPAPIKLRHALATVERLIGDYVAHARLGAAPA